MTYRLPAFACLVCDHVLEDVGRRLVCRSCRSCLVTTAELETSMRAMWPEDGIERPVPPIQPVAGGTRRCPRCTDAMSRGLLVGLEVDRCAAHGVWFDREQLQLALFLAGPAGQPPPPRGVLRTAGNVVLATGAVILELLTFVGLFYS
jgi:hypothetical protein